MKNAMHLSDTANTVLVRSLRHLIDAHAAQLGDDAALVSSALMDAKAGRDLPPESVHRIIMIRARLAHQYHHG